MTGKTVTEDNWGERRVRQRDRQRWAIKAAMVALGLIFVVGVRSLVSAGAISEATTGVIAAGFVVTIALLGWIVWRRTDEIQRRIAINAYAVMGLTCLMLMPLAGGIGPLIGLRQPMLVVFLVAAATVPVSVIFQRLRG